MHEQEERGGGGKNDLSVINRFPQILIWDFGRTTGMFLTWI